MRQFITLTYEGSISITVSTPLSKSKNATKKFLLAIKETEASNIKGYSDPANAIGFVDKDEK